MTVTILMMLRLSAVIINILFLMINLKDSKIQFGNLYSQIISIIY